MIPDRRLGICFGGMSVFLLARGFCGSFRGRVVFLFLESRGPYNIKEII